MPLLDADTPPTTSDLHYAVYFASGTPPWCPYCRDAEPILKTVFSPDNAPTAYIIRVGERDEWKGNPDNKYRQPPYNIDGVPTIVKMNKGVEVARDGIKSEEQLREFIA